MSCFSSVRWGLLTPTGASPHERTQSPIFVTSGPAGVCKNLQAVPNQPSMIGIERPRWGIADPDFPGSAAMCCIWRRPVTPEAAGSSPVDPANLRSRLPTLRELRLASHARLSAVASAKADLEIQLSASQLLALFS